MQQEPLEQNAVTEQELAQINRFSRKKLSEKEVFVFRVILCDNEIDRDMERFDSKALEPLAAMYIGKTGIFDHSMRGRDQSARIFDAAVETDESRLTQCAESYRCIRAKAYMLRTEQNANLIAEIEGGIKKETSVGCAMGEARCSVCGEAAGHCGHKRGKRYHGVPCHTILGDPTDAYEWSFVAVPAQRAAGVTKSFSGAEITPESKAARSETLRLGAAALPSLEGAMLGSICDCLPDEERTALQKALAEGARQKQALRPQLVCERVQTAAANDEFKI